MSLFLWGRPQGDPSRVRPVPVATEARDEHVRGPPAPVNWRKAIRTSQRTGLPPKNIHPGPWYRSDWDVWYTFSPEGWQYTYFRNRWYREHEDQRFRTQRGAGEGTPLLFSGGIWFEEHEDGPPVADFRADRYSVSSLSSGDLREHVERYPVSPLSDDVGEERGEEYAAVSSYHANKLQEYSRMRCDGLGKGHEEEWASFHSAVEPDDSSHAEAASVSVSSTMAVFQRPFVSNPFSSFAPILGSEREAEAAGEETERVEYCNSRTTSSSLRHQNTASTFGDPPTSSHSYETPITASTSYQPVPTRSSRTHVAATTTTYKKQTTVSAATATATAINNTREAPLSPHEKAARAEKEAKRIRKDVSTRRREALKQARRDLRKDTQKALLDLDEQLCRAGRRPAAVGRACRFLVWATTGCAYPHLTYREAREVTKRTEREMEVRVRARFVREERERLEGLAETYGVVVVVVRLGEGAGGPGDR